MYLAPMLSRPQIARDAKYLKDNLVGGLPPLHDRVNRIRTGMAATNKLDNDRNLEKSQVWTGSLSGSGCGAWCDLALLSAHRAHTLVRAVPTWQGHVLHSRCTEVFTCLQTLYCATMVRLLVADVHALFGFPGGVPQRRQLVEL